MDCLSSIDPVGLGRNDSTMTPMHLVGSVERVWSVERWVPYNGESCKQAFLCRVTPIAFPCISGMLCCFLLCRDRRRPIVTRGPWCRKRRSRRVSRMNLPAGLFFFPVVFVLAGWRACLNEWTVLTAVLLGTVTRVKSKQRKKHARERREDISLFSNLRQGKSLWQEGENAQIRSNKLKSLGR